MRVIALILRAGAVVVAAGFLFSLVIDGGDDPVVTARSEPTPAETTPSEPAPAPTGPKAPAGVVTIAATGDIVMGSAPNLPPASGRSLFSDVQLDLAGDVVLGNLEATLATGGDSTCPAGDAGCEAFQTPPSYALRLLDAGFTALNLANDHAFDFGANGLQQTISALDTVGLLHTGRPDEVTIQRVGQIRVALVGFSTYPWAPRVTDVARAKRLVRQAERHADVVIVSMHAGAEGAERRHVRPGTERYRGENRGDVVRFAHGVVDAGADLVVGHGPRVLRGMEWYRGRLIAYSLGTFAAYKARPLGGPLSTSAILRVSLRGDGTYETGRLVATRLSAAGVPALDRSEAAHGVVRELSREDFGARAATVSADGVIGR
jgi:poly-gamma-glutamate capsule biosynthesis protein CapA/YwtB (metallophosphatase superfamily)